MVYMFAVIYYPFLHRMPTQSPSFDTAEEAATWAQTNLPFGMIWHLVNVVGPVTNVTK
jgi:hypothetical protein